jgi:formate dehydrogenase assembly factor FdhD
LGRGLCFDCDRLDLPVGGRAAFDVMQKALVVRIPVVASVSAPRD